MNFLNSAIAQVSDLFRSMTPGARITAGLLLAVVVVSFGYLFRQGAAGPDAYLFGAEPLSDGDLAKIELALGKVGQSGFVREGNRIRVPAGQKAAALAAIADAGAMPSNFNTILQNALDGSKAWESREQSKGRMKDARERQLSEIVRAMSWVDEAVVIYDEQDAKGLSAKKKVTASVSVQPKAGEILDPQRRENLRKLVASAVMGLTPDNVVVTSLGDSSTSGGGGGVDPMMFDDPYYRRKVAFEQYRREQILEILSDIPNVKVQVNADLDETASKTSSNIDRDGKNVVAVRESSTTEEAKNMTAAGGGQPGPASQGPIPPNAAAPQRQNQNDSKNTKTDTESVPGVKSSTVTTQGFTPKEVLATVMIPSKYFEQVWKTRNPTATDLPKPENLKAIEKETIESVSKMVEQLLVKTADQARDTRGRVAVVTLETLPAAPITPPSMASKAASWAGQYWNTIAMLGVAMFSLMVLRSVVKGGPPAASPQGMSAAPPLALVSDDPAAGAHSAAAGEEPAPAGRPRLRLKKGASAKDDLVDIVREDPDAAADILRSWIGKAG